MIHEFGPFKLDARERVLRRHGELVPLTPKVFDVLLLLVENSGHVVTKNEMMQCVWPDTAVEESNLARHVSTLRKALDDGSGGPRYIETIPWRGYRFAAGVRQKQDEPAIIDSLAVLPFLNESADPAAEYLSDGITESLINKLSLVSNLKVMSRNSVFQYKVREPNLTFPDASVVGRELRVRAVLTGRIRAAGGVLVVSVELIDASDNSQLWGAQYKRELSDIFSVQETISREIVDRLQLRLTADDKRQLIKRHTKNAGAYHLYLKGRFFLNKLTVEGVHKAAELFQQAIAKDPDYALAYTGLLDCHIGLKRPLEARKAGIKALELDPSLGEAHASLGFLLTFLHDWNWRKAEAELQRAIELNPNYAQARQWYALYLSKMGRHEEAIHEARLSQQLDPLSLPMNLTTGMALYFARQYGRAIEELQKVLELDANFAAAHHTLGIVYTYKQMCDEAISEFQKTAALAGGSAEMETNIKALTACCYAACGRPVQAKVLLDDMGNKPTVSPYALGMIHAQLGEHRIAMDCLERAYNERNLQIVCVKVDPALDPLRPSRRFQSLLARLGLP
jgi:TolB-like protein/Flp pilus assembly protein TadD